MATPAGLLTLPMGRRSKRTCRKEPRTCIHSVERPKAGIFGDSFVDHNVKASPGRHGAERPNPPTPGGSGVEGERSGEETAWKEGQRRERSADKKLFG